ncbi:hypothetical protein BDQ12DRAFT_719547 [Crucibulum laeve]|uniref:JmjC domain-containing protein n=1 Tax=Crucibulum laeve TaxID=68775 RepID=A0A5C3MBX9_9AGAR|nr:hypothetical protein BDQ12DRAFT_719547 [Crucibulum laeve]
MLWMKECIQPLLQELDDRENSSTHSLLTVCGGQCYNDLRKATHALAASQSSSPYVDILQTLIDTSHEHMRSASSHSVLMVWRRLYTDASIVKALLKLNVSTALLSISILDRAIIVAGGADDDRLDLVISIISKIQSTFSLNSSFTPAYPTTARNEQDIQLPTATRHVPEFSAPPSFLTFQEKYSAHPFVVRNYASDWPAMQDHPWCLSRYLRSISGRGRVVPVEVGKDYRMDSWNQCFMDWDTFLDSLDFIDQPVQESDDVIYMAQHDLMKQFPALRSDIRVPDYVYTSLQSSEYPDYRPPGNEEKLIINSWLGPKGTVSPAHTDPYYNLYVQVVGRKTVWLASPTVSPDMHSFCVVSTSSNSEEYIMPKSASLSTGNTSRVDVFETEREYEDFYRNVVPHAMSVTLEAGDMLFFPPGWWHAMRSEATSFSVSMWF